MTNNPLDEIQIVLVDTQEAANIGSVCRAMKNMGISRLVMVTDKEYDENRIKTLALHALDIWENRKTFTSLKEALKDSHLTIATSRRHGKFRKTRSFTPREFSKSLSLSFPGLTSIVFGCEASGLTDQQVHLCQCLLTIPTSDAFPSLNLSQAVQVVCYELYLSLRKYTDDNNSVSLERASEVASSCTEYLDKINYFKLDFEKNFTQEFIRDIIGRASLTEGEVKRLEKIFSKTSKIIQHRQPTEQN